jgi:glycosyltransferase involved in cell wall biosynthesis
MKTVKLNISAVVLTKNEEKNIERCIKSLMFCDEIIVVDDYSTDKTVHKVHQVHKVCQVYQRKLNGDFATQRNFAMEKVKNDWVLYIDADEIVSEELQKEIVKLLNCSIVKESAFAIKRRDFFMNHEMKYGETKKVRNMGIVRLVKKGAGIWNGNVHEVFHTAKNVGKLNGFLDHYPHPTISEFIIDINLYSSLRAKELFDHNKRTNILEIIFYPFSKFIYTYFIKLGFLDGSQGFIYSFFMSFHSFLVRTKLYQYAEKP